MAEEALEQSLGDRDISKDSEVPAPVAKLRAKRANGTGTVSLHKPTGLYRAVVSVRTADGRKRVTRYAKTEDEAHAKLEDLLAGEIPAGRSLGNPDGAKSLYFIQAGKGGPIKIGVARVFEKRLASMQSSCPAKLQVLKVIPEAGHVMEKHLHRYFAKYRLNGEWFEPHEELLAFIFPERTPFKSLD